MINTEVGPLIAGWYTGQTQLHHVLDQIDETSGFGCMREISKKAFARKSEEGIMRHLSITN